MVYELWIGGESGELVLNSDDLRALLKISEYLDEHKRRWLLINNEDDSAVKMSGYHKQALEVLQGKRRIEDFDPSYAKLYGVPSVQKGDGKTTLQKVA